MSQPPRPVRSGTLPAGEHPGASYSNGMSVSPLPQLSIPPVPAIPSPSTPTSGNSSNQTFVSTPTPLEQSLESKMNLGPTIPVQTDKELPNGPPTVRARSGTKGSSKDKKSMFGVLSGECEGCTQCADTQTDLLNSNDAKKPIISTPYDPIHLTHVGFDYNTGQCE